MDAKNEQCKTYGDNDKYTIHTLSDLNAIKMTETRTETKN